ncbi:hypothetical protein THAOC_36293 [Thalassiosira oceanica]|uniref:Uncharacterized protein n=1 Tax=Thalassiosira oceanica TaxID=159749 RepID=K0R231_THAOC|nr:hypothetical protein THAOC_36293 [Thalassiosira oceanica]|eukprot:EJK45114.1 hypothetical protein THAOC_36293 [Thalassiosira oceanica]
MKHIAKSRQIVHLGVVQHGCSSAPSSSLKPGLELVQAPDDLLYGLFPLGRVLAEQVPLVPPPDLLEGAVVELRLDDHTYRVRVDAVGRHRGRGEDGPDRCHGRVALLSPPVSVAALFEFESGRAMGSAKQLFWLPANLWSIDPTALFFVKSSSVGFEFPNNSIDSIQSRAISESSSRAAIYYLSKIPTALGGVLPDPRPAVHRVPRGGRARRRGDGPGGEHRRLCAGRLRDGSQVPTKRGAEKGYDMSIRVYAFLSSVTAAAMAMYYVFLFRQSTVSFAEFEKALREYKAKKTDVKPSIGRIKYDLGNPNILAVTRTVGNYNEQLAPFLIGMYLYASFVSVKGAAQYGWAWLLFRSYYEWGYRRVPALFLSTIPAYGCVLALIGGTVREVSSRGA